MRRERVPSTPTIRWAATSESNVSFISFLIAVRLLTTSSPGRAAGAAASLIMPFLDNQVNFKNQYMPGSGEGHALQEREKIPLPRSEVEDLVKDAFDSAVERHIEVGDGLQMLIITKDGIEEIYKPLKRD